MNHEPFFTVTGLTAGYGGPDILRGVEFSSAPGLITGILGANGSGKTTLLKAVCGLLPHGGQSLLEGCDLGTLPPRQLARRCAYIPQRSGIGIDISVLDVVLMGYNPHLGLLERPTAQMKETARRALALTGLAGREESRDAPMCSPKIWSAYMNGLWPETWKAPGRRRMRSGRFGIHSGMEIPIPL